MECLNFIMRLPSASAPNKSINSRSRRKTVASTTKGGKLTKFLSRLNPLKFFTNNTPKTPPLKTQVATLKNETTALESKTGVIEGKLSTTEAQVTGLEANLKQAESKISELTTAMGKKVSVLTAGLIAAGVSVITTAAAFLGFKLSSDDASNKAKNDSKKSKGIV